MVTVLFEKMLYPCRYDVVWVLGGFPSGLRAGVRWLGVR